MENQTVKDQIIKANHSSLKFLSLIGIGFSFFALFVDFFFPDPWDFGYLIYYKILDFILAIISITAALILWYGFNKNSSILNVVIVTYPMLCLIWAAIITGIEFSFLGYSTYVIVVLLTTFFLYLNIYYSVVYVVCSFFALLTTMYFCQTLSDNYKPLIFLIVPTLFISILLSVKNFRNKRQDIINREKLKEMNVSLQFSNRNLEIEVEKRTKEIVWALEKAKESDRLKTAFLANLSHEIRTPMNGVIGFAELLKEIDLTGEQQRHYIDIIEKNGERLINIINNIIDISKIESGQINLSYSPVNINDQLKVFYTTFNQEAQKKGINILINNSLTLSDHIIYTDHEKLKTILNNLITNAIKFTCQGSIEIACEKAGQYIMFSVKDTGIGVPKNRMQAIFDSFVHADIQNKSATQGAGLGLAIAKTYVETLGGSIGVESEEGKGTVFYFSIPCNGR